MVSPYPFQAARPRRTWPRRTWPQVAVVAVVVAVYAAGHLWRGDKHHAFDLKIYYNAVNWWASGHDLYDYAQPDKIQGTLPFTYPPFGALVMLPMTWLSLPATIALVWVFNVLALLVTTWMLVQPVAARHGWPRWYAWGLAVPVVSGLEPIRETLTFGQINMLIVLLALGDLLLLVPHRSHWAGVGVGLATAIKLTPGIFVVYLLLTRRWRAAATAVLVTLIAWTTALAYRPQDSWRYFTAALWEAGRVGHVSRIPNQSIWGTLTRLAEPGQPSRLVWLVLAGAAVGYGLWRAVRAWRAGDELVAVTLTGLVGALVSPVTWSHHLYWFVPLLVVLVDAAATAGRGPRRTALLAVAAVTVVTSTLALIEVFDYGWLADRVARTPGGFVLANWYLLGMLAFLALLPIRSLPPGEPPARITLRDATPTGTGGPATDHPRGEPADPDRAVRPLPAPVSPDDTTG